jgi:hypothetical protein
MPMFNFNRVNVSATAVSVAINQLIEAAEPPHEINRQYLGASSVGHECLRRIQYDWMCDAEHPTRLRDIFARQFLRGSEPSALNPRSLPFRAARAARLRRCRRTLSWPL